MTHYPFYSEEQDAGVCGKLDGFIFCLPDVPTSPAET